MSQENNDIFCFNSSSSTWIAYEDSYNLGKIYMSGDGNFIVDPLKTKDLNLTLTFPTLQAAKAAFFKILAFESSCYDMLPRIFSKLSKQSRPEILQFFKEILSDEEFSFFCLILEGSKHD